MIYLSDMLLSLLLAGHNIWRNGGTKRLRRFILEDLLECFPSMTVQYKSVTEVLDGQKEWFIRLDFCSTKDGTVKDDSADAGKDTSPILTIEDVLMRICTSNRGIKALRDIEEKNIPGPARLFLVPFNKNMNTMREFRGFCPPAAASAPPIPRISAISQYSWHRPYHRSNPLSAQEDAEKVCLAAQYHHSIILGHAGELRDAQVLESLRMEGFVFDIFEAENGEMQLLEINPFGVMSGCGSCLFHWINDADLLYGWRAKIDVRLVM